MKMKRRVQGRLLQNRCLVIKLTPSHHCQQSSVWAAGWAKDVISTLVSTMNSRLFLGCGQQHIKDEVTELKWGNSKGKL